MSLETLTRARNAVHGWSRALGYIEGCTPHEVIARRGPARLRHYVPAEKSQRPPVLLVTPIINRFRVVDLQPQGSLVRSLLDAGIEVFLVDWGQPARIDAGIDLADYVLTTLPRFRRAIPYAGPLDVIGYCLGGTISVLYAARFPEALRKLVTLNAPVDFHCDQPHMDLLGEWVQPGHFPVEKLTAAFGNMPHRMISQGFVWQRPIAASKKLSSAWERFGERDFADFWTVLESWNSDGVDVPGAAYRQLIGDLYRDNKLVAGELRLRGEVVELSRITCPTLVVTAANDTTCPPAAARALLSAISSEEGESLDLRGGHLGAIVGPKSPERLHRPLVDWLAR